MQWHRANQPRENKKTKKNKMLLINIRKKCPGGRDADTCFNICSRVSGNKSCILLFETFSPALSKWTVLATEFSHGEDWEIVIRLENTQGSTSPCPLSVVGLLSEICTVVTFTLASNELLDTTGSWSSVSLIHLGFGLLKEIEALQRCFQQLLVNCSVLTR